MEGEGERGRGRVRKRCGEVQKDRGVVEGWNKAGKSCFPALYRILTSAHTPSPPTGPVFQTLVLCGHAGRTGRGGGPLAGLIKNGKDGVADAGQRGDKGGALPYVSYGRETDAKE